MAGAETRRLILDTILSLEKRLIGALFLIAACSLASLFVSQQYGEQLHEDSIELQEAAANSTRAQGVEELVSEFRIATHNHINVVHPGSTAGTTDLTDIAIAIGEEINALRLAGMPLYELQGEMMSFDDLDRHIANIAAVESADGGTEAQRNAIAQRNQEMADLAALIAESAEETEAQRLADVDRAASNWNMFVLIGGLATLGLIGLIMLDLLAVILPAMRSVHRSLRKLARGELDVEIDDFHLPELRELAGPLDTFRRNALAVRNLAYTDAATELPNRRAIIEHVEDTLVTAQNVPFALIVADIDRFKQVNDDFGHAAGDRLVKLVGERMKCLLGPGTMVARVGGDEFAVFTQIDHFDATSSVVREVVSAMRTPIDMGGYAIGVTISAGAIEIDPATAGSDVNALLDRADLALYAAKNEGRNRAVTFNPEMEADRELDRQLERELLDAIGDQQMRMVYQPIHSISGGEREVEALARWNHPKLGEVSPARFIPAAERSGAMVPLGAWIIERALSDLKAWPGVNMSINLSPLQLQQDGFCTFLLSTCCKHNIVPQRLILEVTESLSIERNSRALLTLELLRNAGFRIALDDFGTGYSSLSMMKTFRFDRLKLDRSLIADIASNPTAEAVFEAAVMMALRVGAQVVAEGISGKDLIEPVSTAGCTHLQGFHFSAPIEADDVERYFAELKKPGIPDESEIARRRSAA